MFPSDSGPVALSLTKPLDLIVLVGKLLLADLKSQKKKTGKHKEYQTAVSFVVANGLAWTLLMAFLGFK